MGPFSLDYFRKSNLSASWKIVGLGTSVENNASFSEVWISLSFFWLEFLLAAFSYMYVLMPNHVNLQRLMH